MAAKARVWALGGGTCGWDSGLATSKSWTGIGRLKRVSSGISWEEGRFWVRDLEIRGSWVERGRRGSGTRSRSSERGGRPGTAGAGNPPGAGLPPRRGIHGGMDPGGEQRPTHTGGGGIWGPLPAQAVAWGLHPSHRWNRFLNRIDPQLLLAGRELRLVSASSRARGPHGLGLLWRPPGCPADRLAGQGRSGPGWWSG